MVNPLTYQRHSLTIMKDALARGYKKEAMVTCYVEGESMSPILKQGDIITIRAISPENIRLGDIVVFATNGTLCAHRLVMKIFRGGRFILITKSDNAFVIDRPFYDKKLLGKVVEIKKDAVTLNLESCLWIIVNRILGLYHFLGVVARKRIKYLLTHFALARPHS